MKNRFIIIALLLSASHLMLAQSNGQKSDWVINEIYMSNTENRYGLFVELYNPSDQTPTDLFLTTSLKDPYQYRVRRKSQYHPGLRQKGYRSYKISVIRYRSRTFRIYGKADTLYLFKRLGYSEFQLKDKMPVIWNDTLSVGRCKNQICYFNMATPGRANKNVDKSLFTPIKNYRVTLLGGVSFAKLGGDETNYASSLGFESDKAGNTPSFGVKFQKVANHRWFYTATSAAIFQQGYSFGGDSTITTSTGTVTRSTDGHYASTSFWIGRDIGVFLTPRVDFACGAGIVLVSFSRQVYDESTRLIDLNGNVSEDKGTRHNTPSHYQLPVLTFNLALNYQVTSRIKIESFYNVLFRTFSKKETTYYQSLNLGVSYSLFNKGRGYKEPLLWE